MQTILRNNLKFVLIFGFILTYQVVLPNAQEKPKQKMAASLLVIVKGDGSKVQNASVYVGAGSNYKRECKTDKNGEAEFDDVPIGQILIQVIKKEFRTGGIYYKLKVGSNKVTIKLIPKSPPR